MRSALFATVAVAAIASTSAASAQTSPPAAAPAAPATMAVGQTVYNANQKAVGTIADVFTSLKGGAYAVLHVVTPHSGHPRYVVVPADRIQMTNGAPVMTGDQSHMPAIAYEAIAGAGGR
jgi:hypothetical protein